MADSPIFNRMHVYIAGKLAEVTSRHKQILKLLLAGKINKEIAAELNLSEHVVKNEIRAIFKHFGIHRRCEIFPILETVRQSL